MGAAQQSAELTGNAIKATAQTLTDLGAQGAQLVKDTASAQKKALTQLDVQKKFNEEILDKIKIPTIDIKDRFAAVPKALSNSFKFDNAAFEKMRWRQKKREEDMLRLAAEVADAAKDDIQDVADTVVNVAEKLINFLKKEGEEIEVVKVLSTTFKQ